MCVLDLALSGFGIVAGLSRACDYIRGSSVGSLLAQGVKVDCAHF